MTSGQTESLHPVLPFSVAVEGEVDEWVARKIIAHVGGRAGTIYGKKGKALLRAHIIGYNNAAKRNPWLVLVDLNGDGCAPEMRRRWLPSVARFLCFRIAVHQIEAWLLADREGLASFLSVECRRVPLHPETLANSKAEMVNLARRSATQAIRKDMVPREGSGRSVGPAYSSRLMEYANKSWDPAAAAENAASLRSAIACLRRLIG